MKFGFVTVQLCNHSVLRRCTTHLKRSYAVFETVEEHLQNTWVLTQAQRHPTELRQTICCPNEDQFMHPHLKISYLHNHINYEIEKEQWERTLIMDVTSPGEIEWKIVISANSDSPVPIRRSKKCEEFLWLGLRLETGLQNFATGLVESRLHFKKGSSLAHFVKRR